MPLPIFLDSNVLSKLVLPLEEQDPITAAVDRLLDDIRFKVYVPEIIDYEFRRKLLHLSRRPHQARRWAKELRASEDNLDVDVILAAQANQAGAQIVTTNERHFQGLAEVFDWRSFTGTS
jgi:predicted nucleic acid-binding protein